MSLESEVKASGGPKGYSASTSFATVRGNRHLLKRSPKTYVRLLPPYQETLCYREKEDGTRRYQWIKRFNPDTGCRERHQYDGDGYLLRILKAYPGGRLEARFGYDFLTREWNLMTPEWEEPIYEGF
jgi:hypothetical protein